MVAERQSVGIGSPSIMLYGLQKWLFSKPWRICYLLHYRRGLSLGYFFLSTVWVSLIVLASHTIFLLSFGLLVMSFGFSTSCRWHVFSGGGCSSARSRGSWCPCVSYLPLPWLLSSPISLLHFVPFSCCVACCVLSLSNITCDVSTVPVFSIFSPCQ